MLPARANTTEPVQMDLMTTPAHAQLELQGSRAKSVSALHRSTFLIDSNLVPRVRVTLVQRNGQRGPQGIIHFLVTRFLVSSHLHRRETIQEQKTKKETKIS